MMYFKRCIFVLLFVALLNAESNIVVEPFEPCHGGYCMPKHLCPTGILGVDGVITLRVDEENECGDFMKICCAISDIDQKVPSATAKCGISNPQGLVYNVESNLTYAKYAEFPWAVAIFRKSSSSENSELAHVGGGALIHPKFVLMAAHTLKDAQRYVARFGEWNMKSDAEIYRTQDIEIEEHIRHPSYRITWTLENDIALAVLKENVIYSEHIRPICLPSARDVFDGQQCIATGWGLDSRTGRPPSVMKRIKLKVVPHVKCDSQLRRLGVLSGLHSSIMCVWDSEDQHTCVRDGGSPLACQREDGSYVLAGLASWAVECIQTVFPQGYVDVTKFKSWVDETIKNFEKKQAED